MDIRFVPASLDISFEEVNTTNKGIFKEEYRQLQEYSDDNINEWIKKLKAQGQLEDTDKVLLTLLVELHKKIDNLESIIKQEDPGLVQLQFNSKIYGINFDYIQTNEVNFLPDVLYYARISLPVFPKRQMPLYLYGLKNNIAKIHLISQKNQEDWNSLIMAKEREYIRQIKGVKDDT
jgi:hypothetical protein